jgi:hypothetical protein
MIMVGVRVRVRVRARVRARARFRVRVRVKVQNQVASGVEGGLHRRRRRKGLKTEGRSGRRRGGEVRVRHLG